MITAPSQQSSTSSIVPIVPVPTVLSRFCFFSSSTQAIWLKAGIIFNQISIHVVNLRVCVCLCVLFFFNTCWVRGDMGLSACCNTAIWLYRLSGGVVSVGRRLVRGVFRTAYFRVVEVCGQVWYNGRYNYLPSTVKLVVHLCEVHVYSNDHGSTVAGYRTRYHRSPCIQMYSNYGCEPHCVAPCGISNAHGMCTV